MTRQPLRRMDLWTRRGGLIATILLASLSSSPSRPVGSSTGRSAHDRSTAIDILASPTPRTPREVATGALHRLGLDLKPAEYVRVAVDHPNIDLGLRLVAPDESVIAGVGYRQGDPITLSAVTRVGGR